MTLNCAVALILRYFTVFGSFRAHCIKVVEDTPIYSAAEMYLKESSFSDISRTAIFARDHPSEGVKVRNSPVAPSYWDRIVLRRNCIWNASPLYRPIE